MKILDEVRRRTKKLVLLEAQKIIEDNRIEKLLITAMPQAQIELVRKRYSNVYTHNVKAICLSPDGDTKFKPGISYSYGENEKEIDKFTTECNCWQHGYNNFCSHVVALINIANDQRLLDRNEEQVKAVLKDRLVKRTSNFMEAFSGENSEKKIINLACEPFIQLENGEHRMLLDIAIGPVGGKRYKMNSKMNKFFKAYKKEEYSFGKDYIYSPETDVFDSKSQKILDILASIDEIGSSRQEESDHYYGYEVISSNFKKYGTVVPNIFIERIIDILELESIGRYKIKKSDPKIDFEIEKKYDDIVIKSKNLLTVVTLGDKFLISFDDGGTIHYTTENQVKTIKALKDKMNFQDDKLQISLPAEYTPLPKLLRNLKKVGQSKIGKKLEREILVPQEIKNEIYVESYGQYGIKLREEVLYDGKKPEEYTQIIVTEEEENILGKYERELNLRQLSSKEYLMEEDEDIYNFMTEKVKILKEKAEIFYEDKFTKRKYSMGKVVASSGLQDGVLNFNFSVENIGNDEIGEVLKSIKEKKKFFRLKDGGIINLENDDFSELEKILTNLKVTKEELESGEVARERNYAYFVRQRLDKMTDGVVAPTLKKFANEMEVVNEVEIPAQFSMLREYQRYGVSWLCFLKKYGLGGILADDMGLGKTLQTIAFLSMTLKDAKLPTIIIVPKSLMYNWKSEFERFAPEVLVRILDGGKKSREEIFLNLTPGEVILTSYGTIQRDKELYEKIEFENIILDEAQNIKNIGTKTTLAVKELKGRDRFALTGTPVENNLLELWSAFDFLMPGHLKTHSEFEKNFIKISNYKMLKSLTAPFILRRMKKDVLTELPEKIESSIPVELYPEQKKVYLAYLKKAQQEVSESGENSMVMLSVLTRLRQICSHPGMFLEDYKGESSKVDLLLELLEEYKESGHRVLVFSQFTKIFEIIKQKIEMLNEKLRKEKTGTDGKKSVYSYKYLDGSTSSKDRIRLVEEFNGGDGDFFMISLKAGGTGLNLTGADTVIHLDPWWNPAVEDQATDRAYRMGQKNVVNVLKFISIGTIEEQIDKLKADKKELIQEIFDGEGKDIMKLDKKEILELLKR